MPILLSQIPVEIQMPFSGPTSFNLKPKSHNNVKFSEGKICHFLNFLNISGKNQWIFMKLRRIQYRKFYRSEVGIDVEVRNFSLVAERSSTSFLMDWLMSEIVN